MTQLSDRIAILPICQWVAEAPRGRLVQDHTAASDRAGMKTRPKEPDSCILPIVLQCLAAAETQTRKGDDSTKEGSSVFCYSHSPLCFRVFHLFYFLVVTSGEQTLRWSLEYRMFIKTRS